MTDLTDVQEATDRSTSGATSSVLRRPGVLLVLALAAVAVLAERALLGSGALAGGRLLPAPAGAGELWDAYLAPDGEPRLGLLALLATVLLGRAGLAVDLLVLLSVPLAGATAWVTTRHLVRAPLLRAWVAATWALLPVATGGLATGRLDVAVAQVALPPLLLAAWTVHRGDPRHSLRRSTARLALCLTLVTAFAPQLWPAAAVLLLAAPVLALAPRPRADPRAAGRRLLASAAAVLTPVVVLLPGTWLPDLAALLRGPGLPRPDLAAVDLPAWHLLLLSPGGPGLPPLVVGGGLGLAALAGLLRPGRPRLAAAGWGTALAGLAYALVLARTDVAAGPVWPGVGLQVAAAGLLLAAVAGADGLVPHLQRVAFGWRHVTAACVVLVAALVPVLSAVDWIARGADGPLRRGDGELLPAFVGADLALSGGRSLLVQPRPDGTVAYALARAGGARLGDAWPPAAGDAGLDATVGDLLTPRGSAAAAELAARDVQWVALDLPVNVSNVDATADGGDLARALDAQQGLLREAGGPPLLWRVVAEPPVPRPVGLTAQRPDVARAAWQGLALVALAAAALVPPRRPPLAPVGEPARAGTARVGTGRLGTARAGAA